MHTVLAVGTVRKSPGHCGGGLRAASHAEGLGCCHPKLPQSVVEVTPWAETEVGSLLAIIGLALDPCSAVLPRGTLSSASPYGRMSQGREGLGDLSLIM